MPQLDIMSFSTQIFWVLIFLSILYFILIRFVLPDLLLIFRVRSKILLRLQRKVFALKETDKVYTKAFFNSLKQVDATLNKAHLTNNDQVQVTTFMEEMYNQQKLDIIAFVYSLDSYKKLSLVTPFLILIAPTDEFILMSSFLLFFIIFYQGISTIIVKSLVTPQIEELTTNFTKLTILRKQNLQLMYTNIELLNNTYYKTFNALLLYNTLYTSLLLALKNYYKDTKLNETLFVFKPSQASLDRAFARLNRLVFSDYIFKPIDPTNTYTKLRLVLLISKHIKTLDDPFTQINRVLGQIE